MVWHHQTMAQSLSSLHWASYKSICFSWVALQSVILPLVLDIRHFPETSVRFDHLERHLMFVSLLGRWRRPLPWGVKHFNTNHFIVHPFLPSVRSFVSLPPSICPSVRLSVSVHSVSSSTINYNQLTIACPLKRISILLSLSLLFSSSSYSSLSLSSFLLLLLLRICLSRATPVLILHPRIQLPLFNVEPVFVLPFIIFFFIFFILLVVFF